MASVPQDGTSNTIRITFPSKRLSVPHIVPTSTPLLPDPLTTEIVLFVGYPAMGKSTFYSKHFRPHGYVHVNQDTLRTRDKCVQRVEETLKERKSCVVGWLSAFVSLITFTDPSPDNTNRDKSTRNLYIQLAKKFKVPIRYVPRTSCHNELTPFSVVCILTDQ